MGMRAIWIVPVIASVLILGTLGLSQDVFAIDFSFSIPPDQPVLRAVGEVEFDGTGNIYVTDQDSLMKLEPNGKTIWRVGDRSGSSGDGQFSGAHGLAVDNSGNIYVADTFNHRIQVFDSSGNFITKFGSLGSNPGEFNRPWDVVVDDLGRIYVAEQSNWRVQVFDQNFNFLFEFGSLCDLRNGIGCVDPDGAGPLELGDGQFLNILDIALSESGEIYVGDFTNHRIQVFDSSGNFITKFGSKGFGLGEFRGIKGIAFDTIGNVYVTDEGRVQKFNSQHIPQGYIGRCTSGTNCDLVTGITITFCTDCNFIGQSLLLQNTQGVNVDDLGNIYVTDIGQSLARIQIFDSTGSFLNSLGTKNFEEGFFRSPTGVTVDKYGLIYVADPPNNRIQIFDKSGNLQFIIGSLFGPTFTSPVDIAIGDDERIYVLDISKGQISVFDETGTPLFNFKDSFSLPQGIAVDSLSNIYIADRDNGQVQVFDSEGNFLFKFGSATTDLATPTGIEVKGDGTIYVADRGRNQILVFDSSGNQIDAIGTICDLRSGFGCVDPDGAGPLELGDGQFSSPQYVKLDNSGNLYIADSQNDRIQVLDSSGNFIEKYGVEGLGEGEIDFAAVVAPSCNQNLIVTDNFNARVHVLQSSVSLPPCESLPDVDGDGIFDRFDNCPTIPNPDQTDSDNGGRLDVCKSLIDLIKAIGTSTGTETGLAAIFGNAAILLSDVNTNNDVAACGKLNAFINEVNAQGNNLSTGDAELLIGLAEDLKTSIGC